MKIFKLFFAVAAFVVSLGAQATDTRYDFSFTTDNGITSSGWFVLDDSWTSSTSWQTVTSGDYYGSLNVGVQTGITSGAFSSLQVNNIPVASPTSPYGIKFVVNGITYTALDNKDTDVSEYTYSLAYKPSGGTTTDSEILTHTFSATTQVPEIDGSKLPQAALLILALVFMVSRLKASRPRFNGQFA